MAQGVFQRSSRLVENMKLLVLFIISVMLAPPSLESRTKQIPSLYGHWLGMEARESEDHWIVRDLYDIGRTIQGDGIAVTRICRTPEDHEISVSVPVSAKIEQDTFTILFSEDESKAESGTPCKISIRAGTYHYRLSDDGRTVTVTIGVLSQRWDRYEPPYDILIPRHPK